MEIVAAALVLAIGLAAASLVSARSKASKAFVPVKARGRR